MTKVQYPAVPTAPAAVDRAKTPHGPALFALKADYLFDVSNAIADCQQDLWFTVLFDGTGNNEEIDAPTFEHSNVARLFRAMPDNDAAAGFFTFYAPGIGTPFREIGDPGGKLAMGLALGGEKRLQWAMQQIEDEIRAAEARAKNPVNKIRSINIALFGFSRGAALARAFARRIERKCRRGSGLGYTWKGQYRTRLYFMGLFDTVASVGVPASARKYARDAGALAPMLGVLPVIVASSADGHMDWGSGLQIPAMVEDCVHFCAAHEQRNSFPLDTVLEDGRYPPNCREVVYPGVHSNVGGGYRPGEGGRNANRFAMISLIPLKAMYDAAVKAGVPLVDVQRAEPRIKHDFFPTDRENIAARTELSDRFNHYMRVVGANGKPIGKAISDHMRMYFRWRIIHVGRKLNAAKRGERDWEADRLHAYDDALEAERQAKREELARLASELARTSERSAGHEQLKWDVIEQNARVATMPGDAETLLASFDKYDRQFLEDSGRVRSTDPAKLRPFERVLRDAWDAPPLKDEKIITFFDDYVTDSLAGFDGDRTRATEHRTLYQGGDSTIDYAARDRPSVPAVA